MNELNAIIIFTCLFGTGYVYWKFLYPGSNKNEWAILGVISLIVFILFSYFGIITHFFITDEPVRNGIMGAIPIVESITSFFDDPAKVLSENKKATDGICITLFIMYVFFKFSPFRNDISEKLKSYMFYKGLVSTCYVFSIIVTVMFALAFVGNPDLVVYVPNYLSIMAFLNVLN